MKTALIFGVTGQAGSYLAEILLQQGYLVHGVKRRTSSVNTVRINHIYEDPKINGRLFILHYGDVADAANVLELVKKTCPDEIYNMAAQSHVQVSFSTPGYTAQSTAIGVLNILEAIRLLGMAKTVRFLQASSSEMFGKVQETPQRETTPFYPRSPYAIAKVFGYWSTVNYREAHGLFACNAICFNMESSRRGETFVTRKITRGIASIVAGHQQYITLGNINSKRDWGHAKDYARAMILMLQNEHPDDFVIASGKTWTVKQFLQIAFEVIGVEISFFGEGIYEVATIVKNTGKYTHLVPGKMVMKIDPVYFRLAEVDLLQGDSSKARSVLNWKPQYDFEKIITEMVLHDIDNALNKSDEINR